MSFTITLQNNHSDVNVLSKSIDDLGDYTGTLKEETSILNPVIEFAGSIPTTCNYMTIPEFGRSYFITDVVSTGNNRFSVTGHVDVLTTYKDEIRACTGIIARQKGKWNLYLDDGCFKAYQNPIQKLIKFSGDGFTTQSFILAVAGH